MKHGRGKRKKSEQHQIVISKNLKYYSKTKRNIGLFMSAATNQMGCQKASSGRFRYLFQRVRGVAVKAGVIYSKKGKTEDQTNQV